MACDKKIEFEVNLDPQGHTAPTPVTIKANQAVLKQRPFDNTKDFVDATRGLIAKEDHLVIAHLKGGDVWNMSDYDFINTNKDTPPNSVNPSLWRQALLNNIHGLFKVTEGIYQLRGYDLSNMSIIESNNGWIIVDPLTAEETASHAFLFAQKQLGKNPVKAILFTHSHVDHFGGVQGILKHMSDEERSNVKIFAPQGFEEEATSENIIAGTAMGRRAMYMYGKNLARSQRGHIDTGLGKAPAFGTFGIEAPTDIITTDNLKLSIDGIPFIFQIVSGTEAPAEFTFYLPQHKTFCGAELLSRNLHNIYTLRGAKVRDALLWSHHIEQSRTLFNEADTYFASHHWPLWGNENIQKFLATQRDTYKFIHDQTVRHMNEGLTPKEIAEKMQLPASLNQSFHNQGYYGTVKHNARAVYQHYLGWYTANPSMLDALPESKVAQRYMDMMGGDNNVLKKAQSQFDDAATMSVQGGQETYRWLAELLNHLVFSDSNNASAKSLLAKVYDQLGYQAESGPWRDVYLSAAYELRHGAATEAINIAVMKNILTRTPVEEFFSSMAVRLNAEKAEGKNLNIKISFSDLNKHYLLSVKNSVLRYKEVAENMTADSTLHLNHSLFIEILTGNAGLKDYLFSDDLSVEGSKIDLISFFSLLENPNGLFSIVTP